MIKTIKVGSDFSGVGAFEFALNRIKEDGKFDFKTVFACDLDNYARKTFIENHEKPNYYPKNVYEREIPDEPLDIYMTSPPCQAFSSMGRQLGKDDERGILFFNSLEFIKKNKPRFFIFENVKGLLSDDNGKTFSEWTNLLGGKSVNGLPVLFPYDGAVNYHLYYKVLNAKDFNIPQKRQRIFLVGIRDDADNNFNFPKEIFLTKTLKSILENNVEEKYYLKENNIKALLKYNERQKENNNGFISKFRDVENVTIMDTLKVGGGGKDDLIYLSKELNNNESGLQSEINKEKVEFKLCLFSETITTELTNENLIYKDRVRRLTPRECSRLMDFPESFNWTVSDNQLYKQMGNSICVGVLEKIIRKLKL
jgi:DNA (cytosine-5)-methyltransferase 1